MGQTDVLQFVVWREECPIRAGQVGIYDSACLESVVSLESRVKITVSVSAKDKGVPAW